YSLRVTLSVYLPSYFFFFQEEDGIRYPLVTGVQTCALPIYAELELIKSRGGRFPVCHDLKPASSRFDQLELGVGESLANLSRQKIGRASCRERGHVGAAGRSAREHATE